MKHKDFKSYKLLNWIFVAVAVAGIAVGVTSCGKKDEPNPNPNPALDVYDRVTFIYAINKSSLESDFTDDCTEIVKAMPAVDLSKNKLFLYRTDSDTKTGLYEMTKQKNGYQWKLLKSYDRNTTSTNPDVVKRVMEDAVSAYKADTRTLFFWGHGSSWTPENSDHQINKPVKGDVPVAYGYGGEYGADKKWNWTDIDELADAIPDDSFDTIWFDCCYMASIEVAYELRDKARWFVAYPTEVWDKGLNYDAVLPLTMTAKPNLVNAASTFFKYYNDKLDPVTVTVMDLDNIEPVADAVASLYKKYPQAMEDTYEVVNYRRQSGTPYYDMVQLLQRRVGNDGEAALSAVTNALDGFVVMHLESQTDFNGYPWDNPALCGLSIHNFKDKGNAEDEYYKTLEWHKRVTR